MATGFFPRIFKEAVIKFIPKPKKDHSNALNHRLISLLENVGKLFEKIIDKRIIFHLKTNRYHNEDQQCGRPGRGTQTAIAIAYNEIALSQQDKGQCNVVLRDVSKAFYKVWNNGLKYKVCQFVLPKSLTALICIFLDDRKAQIQIQQHIGPYFNLKSGVPQGSCLSPTLFSIYTCHIPTSQYDRKTIYADDVTQIIRYPGPSKEILRRRTIRAIEEVVLHEQVTKHLPEDQ